MDRDDTYSICKIHKYRPIPEKIQAKIITATNSNGKKAHFKSNKPGQFDAYHKIPANGFDSLKKSAEKNREKMKQKPTNTKPARAKLTTAIVDYRNPEISESNRA